MPQTYIDQDSYTILKNLQARMKKGGISGFTFGDAIRIMWREYQKSTGGEPEDG